MRTASFYSVVSGQNLTEHAHQWRSLTACAQERLVYRKTLDHVPPASLCLDWGCGNGHFSYFLKRFGFTPLAYALDERPALLGAAEIHYTKGSDVTALPFDTALFDAVFAVGVLEHVYERGGTERGSLLELARVLKPGGTLLVFHLPNRFSWIEGLVRLLYRAGLSRKLPHERCYSLSRVQEIVAGTGLAIVEHGRYHMLPRAALEKLPRALKDARGFCAAVDLFDDALAFLFRPICQNWFFILKRA